MSRETWALIKQSKRFYVETYRGVGFGLIISVSINMALGLVLYFLYFSQPEHDFYATSGVVAPVQLTSMDAPNDSATPLLAADNDEANDNKVIPQ